MAEEGGDIVRSVERTEPRETGARPMRPLTPGHDIDTPPLVVIRSKNGAATEPPDSGKEEIKSFLEPVPAEEDDDGRDGRCGGCPCIQRPEPQDAWMASVAGMFVTTCVASEMAAFGIYYVAYSELFGVSKAAAGWIKGLQTLSGAFVSILAGAFIKVYGPRPMVVGAGFCMFGGMFLGSFSPNIYVSYLTHGLLLGVGVSVCNMSVAVCVQQHFTRNKVTGAGISNFGYTLGGISFPIIASVLMENYGLRGSLVVHSAILANIVPLGFLLKSPTHKIPQKPAHDIAEAHPKVSMARRILKELLDVSLLRDPLFVTFLVAGLLLYNNMSMFLSHMAGRAMFYGYSRSEAAYLQSSISIASCCARVVVTFLANLKSVNKALVYGVGFFVVSIATVFYGVCHSYGLWLFASILYGLGVGAATTVSFVMYVQLFSLERLPKVMGYFTLVSHLGLTLGPPIAGLIFDKTSNYDLPFYLSGSLGGVGSIMILVITFVHHRKNRHKTHEDTGS